MNNATLQAKLYAGYAKAALRLGPLCTHFRPTSAANPTAPANQIASIYAAFATEPTFTFAKPGTYAKPVWYALVDGTQTQTADYLSDGTRTFFVAAQEPLVPIVAVLCTNTISVARPSSDPGYGAQPYGGDVASQEVPLMTAWPGSILQGTKGEKSDTNLPGDTRMPWFSVLLPAWPGVMLADDDVLTDDAGRRMKISSAELTGLGWRITAALAAA